MTRSRLPGAAWLLLLDLLLCAPFGVLPQQPLRQDSIPLAQDAGRTDVQDARQVIELTSNSVEDDDVIEERARSQDAQERSGASFGPVTSPFFFMCQYPRQGEASGVEGQDELSVKVEFVGSDTPGQGYQPHTIYEVAVTSSVMFDGFMITGIHALTKDISQTSYLHVPASLHGGASEGLVCAVVHSHISRKPRHTLAFLWMAPPPGTGCVAFLAQGSIGEQILFKDLNVLEVCEKDASPAGQLRAAPPGLSGLALPGFVFREDFEDGPLDGRVWNEMRGGEVRRGHAGQGSSASFFEAESSISTVPLDLSSARHLQFTLGGGACADHAPVQLLLGTALPETQAGEYLPVRGPQKYLTHGPVVSAYTSNHDDLNSGSGGGSGEGSRDAVSFGPHAGDPLAGLVLGTECASWQEAHGYSPSGSGEVHLQVIPLRFRRRGVCVAWRSAPIGGNASVCWSLDDVALATHESSSEPISDDFDPVDPSHWFFFPGASVKIPSFCTKSVSF
ncbi:reelin-like [Penaeus monodon]|uniref:reelin-like n=1 Tax=Penaeus monodon TaxID=6687 RepID=UPI0018A7389A|nr:reelin-like [Penaeus monodon]